MIKKLTKRTPAFVAAIAAVAVMALVLSAAGQESSAQAPQAPARHPRLARAAADLGLTPDQVKALEAFRKARTDKRQAPRQEMDKLRTEMRELARDPRADRARLDELIDRRAKLRAEHEKSALRARAERDKIFTPEQRAKINAFRSARQGRVGIAARGRLAERRAFRSGWARGRRQGWRRGWFRGRHRW
jgi:Spy/CpxP family protein refolding chaperone